MHSETFRLGNHPSRHRKEHFFGTPSGIFGALMAGLMGWLLARSMLETKSLGWALFIHFLHDLVIFGGGAMIIAGTPS
jgi:hypothetical protein